MTEMLEKAIPPAMVIPPSITITNAAARKVFSLVQEENDFSLKLRVYIEGGGCSGFQYGFTFDDTVNEGDILVSKAIDEEEDEDGDGGDSGEGSVEFIIDPMSYQYLVGSEIDYKDDLEGERFIIRNPNASTTCGCGMQCLVKSLKPLLKLTQQLIRF